MTDYLDTDTSDETQLRTGSRTDPDDILPTTITNQWILENFTIVSGRGDARHLMDKRHPDTERVRDTGNSLRALNTDPDTARAITLLAKEKGWPGINIKGSATFKQQVWFEANKLGIPINGYTPTAQDQTALAHYQATTTSDIATRLHQQAHTKIANTVHDTPENRQALTEAIDKRLADKTKHDNQGTQKSQVANARPDIDIGD